MLVFTKGGLGNTEKGMLGRYHEIKPTEVFDLFNYERRLCRERGQNGPFYNELIKKDALLYIIVGKYRPVCFFSQGVELLFCFKNMIQNPCFVCQGIK